MLLLVMLNTIKKKYIYNKIAHYIYILLHELSIYSRLIFIINY